MIYMFKYTKIGNKIACEVGINIRGNTNERKAESSQIDYCHK